MEKQKFKMMNDIKKIARLVIGSIPMRFGIIFILAGISLLLLAFSESKIEYLIEGLIWAAGLLLAGIILLLFGSSSVEPEKRKKLIGIVIIWIGILLIIIFPISIYKGFSDVSQKSISWSDPMVKQMFIPIVTGCVISGFIILSIGIFILKSIKEEAVPISQKILGIKKRNHILVLIFSIVTFGIYHIYWLIKTRKEINSCGASIPNAWLLIIPIVNLYFFINMPKDFLIM